MEYVRTVTIDFPVAVKVDEFDDVLYAEQVTVEFNRYVESVKAAGKELKSLSGIPIYDPKNRAVITPKFMPRWGLFNLQVIHNVEAI